MVVYSLLDPNDGIVRYIGITTLTAKKRFAIHLKDAKTKRRKGLYLSKKEKWLLKLFENNQRPIVSTLFTDLAKSDAEEKEKQLIALYKRTSEGGILYNVQEGGEFHSDMMTPWNKDKHNCYSKDFLLNNKLNQPNSKKVYRFTKEGELIDVWNSTRDMCITLNFDRRTVMRCLHKEENFISHKGYMFSYESTPPQYVNKSTLATYHNSPHAKSILVTFKDGQQIKFNSIKEAAEKLEIHASCISSVMKTTQSYKQYKFKFL